jgi:hypothetical protein
VLVRDDGARFAVLVSHADEQLKIKPVLADGSVLAALGTGEVVDTVSMGPFGITVFSITGN